MKRALIVGLTFLGLFLLFYSLNKEIIFDSYYEKSLKVSMEVIVPDDDILQLFYRGEADKFNEQNSQKLYIKGRPRAQKIHFKIPDSLDVHYFRFDFGNKHHTSVVVFNEIRVSINGNSKTIYDSEIEEYFTPNKYAERTSSGFSRKIIGDRSDPFFTSKDFSGIIRQLKGKTNWQPNLLNIILSIAFSSTIIIAFWRKIPFGSTSGYSPVPLISVFLFLLIIPHFDELFSLDKTDISEKRNLLLFPDTSWNQLDHFPEDFEAYYNDHFGFREFMVSLYATIKLKVFSASPDEEKVIVGKDDWIFYWKEDIQKSYLNSDPFTPLELKNYGDVFLKLDKELKSAGKLLITTIFPNKHTVYEEKLPSRISRLKVQDVSRTVQFLQYMESNEILTVPLNRAITQKKDFGQLYLKNDTHWNSLGAFYAYQNLIKEINKVIPETGVPLNLGDFKLEEQKEYKRGDLIDMLGIDNSKGIFIDTYITLTTPSQKSFITTNGEFGRGSVVIENRSADNELTALFFGDSYTHELKKFLPLHFRKTIFIRNIRLNSTLIKKINPDVVIYGIVERNLQNF